jgi:hypothetical protein
MTVFPVNSSLRLSGCCPPASTMKAFIPPVISGDAQMRNASGVMDHLGYFLIQGHGGRYGFRPFFKV